MPQPATHNNNPARGNVPDRVRPAPDKAKPALDRDSVPNEAKLSPVKASDRNAPVAALAGVIHLKDLA